MTPISFKLTAPNVLSENEYAGKPTKDMRSERTYGPPFARIHVNMSRKLPEMRISAKRMRIGIGAIVPRPNMAETSTTESSMVQSKSHSTIISPSDPANVREVFIAGAFVPKRNSLNSTLLTNGKSKLSKHHSSCSRKRRFIHIAIQPSHMC